MGRLSIRSKLHLCITALVLLICVGTAYIFYYHSRQVLFDEIRERLAALAGSVAVQIDAEAHRSLLNRKDEYTPAYKEIRTLLRRVEAADPTITYIYTMRPGKRPLTWEFVVDADDEPCYVGEEYNVSAYPELQAGLSGPSADTRITHDKGGDWVSGYAPIRDKAGRSIGIVGVDMSVNQLAKQMSHMRWMGILCILLAALISLALSQAVFMFFLSPIGPFIERLKAAARGDLETLIDDRRNDEIGEVARTFNDLLRSLKHKDKMLSQMNTDYLTGLNNHRYFQERLQEEIQLADRHSWIGQVALLMLDLDRFKLINDSFGHVVGDDILRQVAKLIADTVSEKHSVARYGGEEFTVILPDAALEDAVATAEHLRKSIATHDFAVLPVSERDGETANAPTIAITVSIGVAVYPLHSKEKNGLIMATDIALYRAKHLGRDRVHAYEATLTSDDSDPYHVYTFIQDPTRSAIEALAAAVDARDHYTRNHSENVTKYSLMIGEHIGLKPGDVELLRMASLLHDVGKIGVPDYVLNKPSSLTQEEMSVIRAHPAVGEAIVRNSRNLDAILPGILYHHEHYDGAGYPRGLSGQEIPLLARIISVADAFDALTTDRPYRRALSASEAVEVLRTNAGAQFDPGIVEAFVQRLDASSLQSRDLAA